MWFTKFLGTVVAVRGSRGSRELCPPDSVPSWCGGRGVVTVE